MPSKEKRRLFLGVKPSPESLKDLVSLQQQFKQLSCLARQKGACRWIGGGNIHLTLHFLGEVEEPMVEALSAALSEVTGISEHDQLLDRPIAFPKLGRARVAGVGSKHSVEPLVSLHQSLGNIIKNIGIKVEDRRFRSHVTLVRFRQPVCLAQDELERWVEGKWISLRISSFELFESHLSSEGSRYQILKQFPLATSK